MGQPYVGEIRMFGGNFAPAGWAFCNGQLMPISENDTLFNLIGTTYGGDGQETFGLPNLQGRVPVHMGTGSSGSTYVIGELSGTESVTVTTNQLPVHTHTLIASTDAGGESSPLDNILAGATTNLYFPAPATAAMGGQSGNLSGGSQPHDNMMPFLVISFIISLYGIFPSQT